MGEAMSSARSRQIFDGVAVAILLLFTGLGDATAMMAAAVLVLVIGVVAFPADRRVGLTTAFVAALVAVALGLVRTLWR